MEIISSGTAILYLQLEINSSRKKSVCLYLIWILRYATLSISARIYKSNPDVPQKFPRLPWKVPRPPQKKNETFPKVSPFLFFGGEGGPFLQKRPGRKKPEKKNFFPRAPMDMKIMCLAFFLGRVQPQLYSYCRKFATSSWAFKGACLPGQLGCRTAPANHVPV